MAGLDDTSSPSQLYLTSEEPFSLSDTVAMMVSSGRNMGDMPSKTLPAGSWTSARVWVSTKTQETIFCIPRIDVP